MASFALRFDFYATVKAGIAEGKQGAVMRYAFYDLIRLSVTALAAIFSYGAFTFSCALIAAPHAVGK